MPTLQRAEPWMALAAALLLVLSQTATCTAEEDGSSVGATLGVRLARRKTLVIPGLPPVSTGLLLPLSTNIWASIRRRNPTFRHASLGFVPGSLGSGSSSGAPRWTYLDRVDWQQWRMVRPVQNQATCAACWAMAAVAAVESLYAIITNAPPPAISTQRLLECAPNTPRKPNATNWNTGGASGGGDDLAARALWRDGCEGGWSAEAFDFMAVASLPAASAWPFIGARGTRNTSRGGLCLPTSTPPSPPSPPSALPLPSALSPPQQQQQQQENSAPPLVYADNSVPFTRRTPYKGPFSITMFEETALEGYLGMILALQKQPVVAGIEADQPSFVKYNGTFVYSDPACFLNGVVDHSVLVIGYDLTAPVPHWIILNSWGAWWGDWGVMRLAMAGGDGICGIHSQLALYPVIATPDPCFPINPCGGGKCAADAVTGGNTCECPEGFRVVVNIDGSQSCALARRCEVSMVNPCDAGMCVDSSEQQGGYTCLCPPPLQLVNNTDGSHTCIFPPPTTAGSGGTGDDTGSSGAGSADGLQRVRVLEGMTCGMLALTFRLTVEQLQQTNPGINCNSLEIGSFITVNTSAATVSCSLSYAASPGDTCASVEALCRINTTFLVRLNPHLDCAVPFATPQSVCVAAAGTPLPRRCAQWYTPQANDTCRTIMRSVAAPPLPPAYFFALNPGFSCSRLEDNTVGSDTGVQVCVKAAADWTGAIDCDYRAYSVVRGDTCARILALKFRNSARWLAFYNYGAVCTASSLYVGKTFCLPPGVNP